MQRKGHKDAQWANALSKDKEAAEQAKYPEKYKKVLEEMKDWLKTQGIDDPVQAAELARSKGGFYGIAGYYKAQSGEVYEVILHRGSIVALQQEVGPRVTQSLERLVIGTGMDDQSVRVEYRKSYLRKDEHERLDGLQGWWAPSIMDNELTAHGGQFGIYWPNRPNYENGWIERMGTNVDVFEEANGVLNKLATSTKCDRYGKLLEAQSSAR